jgi:hypothetical protein
MCGGKLKSAIISQGLTKKTKILTSKNEMMLLKLQEKKVLLSQIA